MPAGTVWLNRWVIQSQTCVLIPSDHHAGAANRICIQSHDPPVQVQIKPSYRERFSSSELSSKKLLTDPDLEDYGQLNLQPTTHMEALR